jgi:hypothetical protein
MGIGGNCYFAIKALYRNTWAQVRVNHACTDPFPTPSGVRQGDTLSPTLFIAFMSDLSRELNENPHAVKIGALRLNHLLYADDIVLLAESETALQSLLDTLAQWCFKWCLKINTDKSKVMHFRKKRQAKTRVEFVVDDLPLELVRFYKYLGVHFDEHLTFKENASFLSAAADRALGALIAKYKSNNNMSFFTYQKLFENCVAPILDYGSHVFGNHSWGELERVQTKAARIFLGVHKFAATSAIVGDVGWVTCYSRHKLNHVRYFNKLLSMPDDRMTKKVFLAQMTENNSWMAHCQTILSLCNHFDLTKVCSVEFCADVLRKDDELQWEKDVLSKPKLRLYRKLKTRKCSENYVIMNLSPSERSFLAQLRFGILPLAIETGRFSRTPVENRICSFCSTCTEDELHFLFVCPQYQNARSVFLQNVQEFVSSDKIESLEKICTNAPRQLAKFVKSCFLLRRNSIFITT